MDRALATLVFRFQAIFARTLADWAALAAQVEQRASRLGGDFMVDTLSQVRYRLRRDGFRLDHLQESFALYMAAAAAALPQPEVLAAARCLVQGGIAELEGAAQRQQALALAAFVRALHDGAVHVLTTSDTAARALADSLRAPFGAVGLQVGCVTRGASRAERAAAYANPVVCGALREVAQDYLRDAIEAGAGRPGRFSAMLQGPNHRAGRFLLKGLHCALVADAELAMLDDAANAVIIAAEADQTQDRLMYEQAMELARGLKQEQDFQLEDGEIRLTAPASQLLERLVTPLGGIWSAKQQREELVGLALEALNLFERDVDYRVTDGKVAFAERPAGEGEPNSVDEQIKRLVEIKEGCPLSVRREVKARISVPRFLSRYLHIAGVAADARGLEAEFWSMYSLKTSLAGPREPDIVPHVQVFATSDAKRAAVADAVRNAVAAGEEVFVVARTAGEAQALQASLARAGVQADDAAVITMQSPTQGVPPGRTSKPRSLVIAELLDERRHIGWLSRACGARSCMLVLSIQDEGVRNCLGGAVVAILRMSAGAGGTLSESVSRFAARLVQRRAEVACRSIRQHMLTREKSLDDLLAFSGPGN